MIVFTWTDESLTSGTALFFYPHISANMPEIATKSFSAFDLNIQCARCPLSYSHFCTFQ